MDAVTLHDLYKIGSAATDVGMLDWARRVLLSGALAVLLALLVRRFSRLAFVVVVLLSATLAHAQEAPADDEVSQRLHFIEGRLKAETVQVHAWEAGWTVVDFGGVGYGIYQISQSGSNAQLAQGIVSTVKSIGGVAGITLSPLKTGRGTRELDGTPDRTPDERRLRLVLAESLLKRNAHEADIRYSWKPHVISVLINLAGGAVIWIAGDMWAGLQSAGIGIAVGELQIWTRPWQAKRDLREYRQQFGGMSALSAPQPRTANAGRASMKILPTGLQIAF